MARTISKNAIDTISSLNSKLFDAENEMRDCESKVSAQRHFLAADPNADNVYDLMVAVRQLDDCRQRVESLRNSLKKAIWQVYIL